MNELLPWHQTQWQTLLARLRAGSLPHALLLCGPAGLGKVQFAAFLVQTLLCETGIAQGEPCRQCRSCLLFAAHNHPDLRMVSPVEEGKVIGVDQIREVCQYLTHTSQFGGHKAVVITPAEQMNLNAANSLLKTLEEPSRWSLLLLVTDRPGRLPATILSRCQRLNFATPEAQMARGWLAERIGAEGDPALLLALAEGAPLRALQLAEGNALAERAQIMQTLEGLARGDENPSAAAEQLLKIGVQQTLYWMYNWAADMVRYSSCADERYLVSRDMGKNLVKLSRVVGPQGLQRCMRQVNEALRLSRGQANPQLLLEDVLMAWQDTFQPAR